MKDKTPSPFNSGSTAGLPDPFKGQPSSDASFFTGGSTLGSPPKPQSGLPTQPASVWPNAGIAPMDPHIKAPGTAEKPLPADGSKAKGYTTPTNKGTNKNKQVTSLTNRGKSRSKTF